MLPPIKKAKKSSKNKDFSYAIHHRKTPKWSIYFGAHQKWNLKRRLMFPSERKELKIVQNEDFLHATPYRKSYKIIKKWRIFTCYPYQKSQKHQKMKNFHMLTPIEKVKHHQKIETFHMVHPTRKVKESWKKFGIFLRVWSNKGEFMNAFWKECFAGNAEVFEHMKRLLHISSDLTAEKHKRKLEKKAAKKRKRDRWESDLPPNKRKKFTAPSELNKVNHFINLQLPRFMYQ